MVVRVMPGGWPANWWVAACLTVFSLALAVAAAIKRQPPDFSALPPLAVVRNRQQHKLWTIRVAAAAHLIAIDTAAAPPAPAEHAFQLWLTGPNGSQSLGLLPPAGRKIIPQTPRLIARLDAHCGELGVTLEPARGSVTGRPSGPLLFRAGFAAGLPLGSDCAMVASVSGLLR